MKHQRRSWLALWLAAALCVAPGIGLADFDAQSVEPLVTAVASAAAGASVDAFAQDDQLTEAFAAGVLAQLVAQGVTTAETAADPAAAEALLESLLAVDAPQTTAADAAATLPVAVLAVDASEDGEAAMLVAQLGEEEDAPRAAVELRKDETSPVGWKLYRFTTEDAALIEAVMTAQLTREMQEYVNAACAYSIQYPSLFTEDMIQDKPDGSGIEATLPDESASFSVSRVENAEKLTLEALLEREKAAEIPAETAVNAELGYGTSLVTDEEGYTHAAIFYVTEAYIYEAELNYLAAQAESYAPYVEIMINSFMIDELGAG